MQPKRNRKPAPKKNLASQDLSPEKVSQEPKVTAIHAKAQKELNAEFTGVIN
jgi:hypothetical protein